MIKYVDNSFHALKVGFANEIGAIGGSSSHIVMDDFLSDTRLNVSQHAGPVAFGVSCLPSVRALTHAARRRDVESHCLPTCWRPMRPIYGGQWTW